ncbi:MULTISPECIES: LuxR C-terminal-related transcriptional regulator [Streptomyces]|uniref:LuxR C-terminal-related transcriptional regulator n=1 Tax=Streptomyces griseiscabiei TaxID=2993540 RepID=A0ABU4KZX7_9ACTN|nr:MULTISPECIES: LuxR C-terminal-related transcriptional regulator [Streptomyces]MBZ3900919.1 helix-turn-helix domain-containing protein [Streptomyces griseiscabiei]MDX2908951.1 LuxR C-terminal-related transcriptional regulator [Streptomyces griseiscabiei]
MCGESDIGGGAETRGEVCGEGIEFYRTALSAGRVPRAEAPACVSAFGLVVPAVDDPETLVPIPPSVASAALAHPLERLILDQQQALAAVRASMSQAESVYRAARRLESESSQRLTPAPAITAALDEAIRGTRNELLTAHPGGRRPEEVLVKALPRTLEAHRKGVKQRTLYQHTVRAHGPTLDYIKQVTELGVEVRTVDEVFDRMIICDRAVAFIPDMGKDHGTHALKVTDPGVVHFLVSAFEYAWERAKPVVYEHDQQRPPLLTDETRLHVLRLMVDGYTDAAIAGRLGISARTVASHLKKVGDLLGSNSRAQLAYLTAKSGLLEDAADCDCERRA